MRLDCIIGFCILSTFLLSGCSWDPQHTNPVDPRSPYYQETGDLCITVQTLNRQPISGATVLIKELGRFTETNAEGIGVLQDLPVGSWWVVSYRDNNPAAIYARDSILATIRNLERSDLNLQLDALPRFESTSVTAWTKAVSDNENSYRAIFRARVNDPDGLADLAIVKWVLPDLIEDTLRYMPDSVYWWSETPGDSFPTGSLDDIQGLPVYFEAMDFGGNLSRSDPTYLWRVIHDVPQLLLPHPAPDTTKLNWTFQADDFPRRDSTQFNYIVRIFTNDIPLALVYENVVPPPPINRVTDYPAVFRWQMVPYNWEVRVLDRFGNLSQSNLGRIDVPARSKK